MSREEGSEVCLGDGSIRRKYTYVGVLKQEISEEVLLRNRTLKSSLGLRDLDRGEFVLATKALTSICPACIFLAQDVPEERPETHHCGMRRWKMKTSRSWIL